MGGGWKRRAGEGVKGFLLIKRGGKKGRKDRRGEEGGVSRYGKGQQRGDLAPRS